MFSVGISLSPRYAILTPCFPCCVLVRRRWLSFSVYSCTYCTTSTLFMGIWVGKINRCRLYACVDIFHFYYHVFMFFDSLFASSFRFGSMNEFRRIAQAVLTQKSVSSQSMLAQTIVRRIRYADVYIIL